MVYDFYSTGVFAYLKNLAKERNGKREAKKMTLFIFILSGIFEFTIHAVEASGGFVNMGNLTLCIHVS